MIIGSSPCSSQGTKVQFQVGINAPQYELIWHVF
jgi:hypothetical protein